MFLLFVLAILLFLFSINYIRENIDEKITERVKDFIISINHNRFLLLIIGVFATIIVQSSSLIISLVVILTGSKKITFYDSLFLMMGANIGTCSTAFIKSFNSYYLIILILLIYIFLYIFKKTKLNLLFGIFMLLISMEILDIAVLPLSSSHFFRNLFSNSHSTFLNILISSLFTSITQSSSVVVASLQSFSYHNIINIKTATDMIMGANIGTCMTAFLVAFKGGTLASKSARFNLLFNIVGVISFIIFRKIVPIYFLLQGININTQIAIIHLLFNIVNVLVFLPFLFKRP